MATCAEPVTLGTEMTGFDLSRPLDAGAVEAIQGALDRHGVIVFRDQDLTPEQQIAFSRRLGELERYTLGDYLLPGHPEIFVVSNIIEDGRPIGLEDAGQRWHTDMTMVAQPPRGSALYALEVPTADGEPRGDTQFASTAAAYDALPAATRQRIDRLQVVHSYDYYIAQRRAEGRSGAHDKNQGRYPDVVHPLVRRHPRTGRRCLYLTTHVMRDIVGLEREAAQDLLAELLAHATQPAFTYRHRWRVGDLVIWDNCSAIHRATMDYALPLRRRMHRTTLAGTPTA